MTREEDEAWVEEGEEEMGLSHRDRARFLVGEEGAEGSDTLAGGRTRGTGFGWIQGGGPHEDENNGHIASLPSGACNGSTQGFLVRQSVCLAEGSAGHWSEHRQAGTQEAKWRMHE